MKQQNGPAWHEGSGSEKPPVWRWSRGVPEHGGCTTPLSEGSLLISLAPEMLLTCLAALVGLGVTLQWLKLTVCPGEFVATEWPLGDLYHPGSQACLATW